MARAVGVDERIAVQQLEAVLAPPAEQPALAAPARPVTRVNFEYALAACAAAALVAGLFGWGVFEGAAARANAVVASSAVVATPVPASPDEAVGVPAVPAVGAQRGEPEVAPAGPTQLVIRTQPAGARVTVNGIGWGVSPVTVRHVEPGEKRIRVTMDGYRSSERSVVVDEGARQTVRIRLVESGL